MICGGSRFLLGDLAVRRLRLKRRRPPELGVAVVCVSELLGSMMVSGSAEAELIAVDNVRGM